MINNVCVIGAGTMGNGIAHVFIQNGFQTLLVDQSMEILERAMLKISDNMGRQVKKNTMTEEDKERALALLKLSDKLQDIDYKIDLVIEAIIEKKEAKVQLFETIIAKLSPECILASNTSSISITELAPKILADRFIGMHFMNPVPVMALVEVIKGHSTSEATFDAVYGLVEKLNKVPVSVNDSPGFISNRVLMQLINEAVFCVYENISSVEDIDKIFKLGMNHPMGPLTLADFIGLDVCLDILNVMYSGFKDSKYRPCPLLVKMVAAGKVGRKVGEGFYHYNT